MPEHRHDARGRLGERPVSRRREAAARVDDNGQPDGPQRPSPLSYVSVGFELAIPLLVLMAGGWWLDEKLGSDPWLTVAGALLGMAVGFYGLFRRLLSDGGRRG